MLQLSAEPSGQTPLCAQLSDVITQVRNMSDQLRMINKIAVMIIMTDGGATDGDIVDILKPLEGLPLKIIVRIYTDEVDVIEYWSHINSQLDIEIYVLDSLEGEATTVIERNNWLTYGEPLHRLREFGILLPGMDKMAYKQLSKKEIGFICQLIL